MKMVTQMPIKIDVLVIPGLILLLVGFLYEALHDYLIAGKLPLTIIEICVICLIAASLLLFVWSRVRRTRSKLYRQFVALTLFLMTFTAIHASLTAIMVNTAGGWNASARPCLPNWLGGDKACTDLQSRGLPLNNLAMILSLPLNFDEMQNWFEDHENYMLCDWLANNSVFLWWCNSFLWAIAALPFWVVSLLFRRHRHSLPSTNVHAVPETSQGAWPPPPSQLP